MEVGTLVWIPDTPQATTDRVEVPVSPYHTHPLILGTNWSGFQAFREISVDESCISEGRGEMCAALPGEAVPVPSRSGGHQGDIEGVEGTAPPSLAAIALGDFLLEQSRNETPRHAFDQVRVIDSQQIQPNVALSHPYYFLLLRIGYIE